MRRIWPSFSPGCSGALQRRWLRIDARQLAECLDAWDFPGVVFRPVHFEPTFHKHAGKLCAGMQVHVEDGAYDHTAFRPWRLMALVFKALRRLYPDYELWRDFPYEYEFDRLAIDLINGSELLRQWVDDPAATPDDLDAAAGADEAAWLLGNWPDGPAGLLRTLGRHLGPGRVQLLPTPDAPDADPDSGQDPAARPPADWLARLRALFRRVQPSSQPEVLRFADLELDTGTISSPSGYWEVKSTTNGVKRLIG